jgi:hypothetical protein
MFPTVYSRIKIGFLLLVLSQGLHSIEEYYTQLWTVLAPARFLSSLVSEDLKIGFLIINAAIFLVATFCWIITTGKNKISNQALIWFWVFIEGLNGIGHLLLALNAGSYFPGLITAPLLLILSIYLWRQLLLYNRLSFPNR